MAAKTAPGGLSSRLFGSAVRGMKDKPERAATKVSKTETKTAPEAMAVEEKKAKETSAEAVKDTPAPKATTTATSSGGARGRGPRIFGGGSFGGSSEALDGGSVGRFSGDDFGGPNPRASAFARAFDVEESDWKPLRGDRRGRRLGPYDAEEESLDYNGFPRYARFDSNEPEWEHDCFDGPQSIGSAIFVRNLPPGIEAHQLTHLFEEAGPVSNIQVDSGPLPTATIGYVRQDVALHASELFNGRWLRGHELKVTVKHVEINGKGSSDDDFWKKELHAMKQQGRLMRNDPYALMAFGAYDDDWSSGWASPWGAKGFKGAGKGYGVVSRAEVGRKGPPEPRRGVAAGGGGMRSALAWDD